MFVSLLRWFVHSFVVACQIYSVQSTELHGWNESKRECVCECGKYRETSVTSIELNVTVSICCCAAIVNVSPQRFPIQTSRGTSTKGSGIGRSLRDVFFLSIFGYICHVIHISEMCTQTFSADLTVYSVGSSAALFLVCSLSLSPALSLMIFIDKEKSFRYNDY